MLLVEDFLREASGAVSLKLALPRLWQEAVVDGSFEFEGVTVLLPKEGLYAGMVRDEDRPGLAGREADLLMLCLYLLPP